MSAATTQQMLEYFNQLNNTEQETILQMLKKFLHSKKDGASAITLESYTRELVLADAEIEAGDFILHEDVVKFLSKK